MNSPAGADIANVNWTVDYDDDGTIDDTLAGTGPFGAEYVVASPNSGRYFAEITTATALSGIGRFYIRNSSKVLSVDTVNTVTNALNLYKTDNNIRVTGLTAQGNATIKMYTISGKEVLANQFVAERVKDIALPTNLATGVYIVSVVSENGKINKKLIIE